MRIHCIGGGPGGLFFSILMKKAHPSATIHVHDKNPKGNTFGWGVVFSDATLNNFLSADTKTSNKINNALNHWDDIDVHYRGQTIRSSGHGFCGISRIHLLEILANRAEELGVKLHYESDVSAADFPDADLIVAADGVTSKTRETYAEYFKPDLEFRKCRYIWLGTKKTFDAFTFILEETKFGWFQAHCYKFEEGLSTFIVECPEEVWTEAGIGKMSKKDSIGFCEELFAPYLGSNKLIDNINCEDATSAWINFLRVSNEKWHHKNIVLLGDAAATAHFSIGSGTKLAMESAIFLTKVLSEEKNLETAFSRYETERRLEVLKLQSAARNSTEWFESVDLKSKLEPEQLNYSLLTRSQRIGHENLRLRDPIFVDSYENWFKKQNNASKSEAAHPMFLPLKLREIELYNRVAVSPMAMYSAVEGTPTDFHLVHFGSLALGGAGLIFTEMTNVSPEARITPGCAGMYKEEHISSWKRIVDFVHSNSSAKIALQLGHSGRKGSTRVAWEGMDEPLDEGNWEILAPSALPYTAKNQVPKEMTLSDMESLIAEFVSSTRMAIDCGFDFLELHCAHGYLLSTFLSPLTNKRKDEFGGDVAGRAKFPLEVFSAMRAVWPKELPMSVRISASDWVEGGNTIDDAVEIARLFSKAGADIIDVSSGQVSPDQKPVYGRMYQTPFSDRIRAELDIKTMAVGNIYEPDHVNSILAAGRADLCLLARPHLADPHWTLRAAADLGYKGQEWPKQYVSAKRQLEVNLQRAKEQI